MLYNLRDILKGLVMKNQNKNLAVIFFANNCILVNIDEISDSKVVCDIPMKNVKFTILTSKQQSELPFYAENIGLNVDLESGCIFKFEDILNKTYTDRGCVELFDDQDKEALMYVMNNPTMHYTHLSSIQHLLGNKINAKHELAVVSNTAEYAMKVIRDNYSISEPTEFGK